MNRPKLDPKKRKKRGNTLVEAMFACFITLTSALVFSATVPVANASRKKAESLAIATSIAQKEVERLRATGYASMDGTSLTTAGLVDSSSLVNLQAAGLTTTAESGYEFTNGDNSQVDSPSKLLNGGRGFVELSQVDTDSRSAVVVVFWNDNGQWRSARIGTIVANM